MIDAYEKLIRRVVCAGLVREGGAGAGAAGGYMAPEGEVQVEEDAFEEALREAGGQMKGLDEKLMRVESLPVLAKVRDILAKQFGVKPGDVTAQWKALHKASGDEEQEKALAPFQVDVTPSEKPEDLKEVFNELVKTYNRFIVFKDRNYQATACALWTMATWFVDFLNFAPYILITAPEKRCGKSQLWGLMARLSRRPLKAGSMSAPVLFRAMEKFHPTFFIDEADSFLDRDEDLKGMIKCGIERGETPAWRCEKDPVTQKQDIVPYDTFGFKALSGISAQNIDGPITDRSIVIELKRKLKNEKVPKVREERPEKWKELNAKCARLALDYGEKLRNHHPAMPSALNDRDADKWEPLIALADLIDGDDGLLGPFGKLGQYGNFCRAVAVRLCSSVDADEPRAVELLRNIREVLDDTKETAGARLEYILSYLLVQRLVNNEEWCWRDYRRGEGISPRMLATMLKQFNVHPKKNLGPERKSGYMKADFEDPFRRYLSDEEEAPV